mgnify:CR=1 FL=1
MQKALRQLAMLEYMAWAAVTISGAILSIVALVFGCAARGALGDPCSYNAECQPGLFCDQGACAEFGDGTDADATGTDAAEGTDSGSDAAPDSGPTLGSCGGDTSLYAETIYDGRCFRLPLADAVTWDEAATRCIDFGAGWHLATTIDDPESTAAYGVLAGAAASSAWIGLESNGTDCTFAWITGEALSWTPWGMSQPDNCVGTRSCGHFWSGPTWGDMPCDGALNYLCESS